MNTWRKVGCCLAVAAVAAFGAFGGTTLFVDGKSQGAAEPYGTPDTAATTITAAMTYVGALGDEAFPVEIRVAEGKYTETGFTLDKAIAIVGMTGDPKDVEIVDAVAGKRAFTITDADALVKDLTISGGGLRIQKGEGGHIYMTAGTVEHCVIRDGVAGWTTNSSYELGSGGNVFMTGGKLVRCQVLNGTTSAAAKGWTNYGGGVCAANALIESCLFAGNGVLNAGATCGGAIYASGSTVVANCTVVDNKPAANGGGGIYVNSADVKVVNTVFFNNGGDLAKEIGPSRHDQFSHCASSVTNEDCATWQVMSEADFAGYSAQDFHLAASSSLVDSGTTASDEYPIEIPEFDLDGSGRVSGEAIDLGCYEIDQSVLTVSGNTSVYGSFEGSNIVFSASAKGGSGVFVFRWDFGNNVIRDTEDAEIQYAYPDSGLYQVRLAASDDGGSNWSDWVDLPTKVVVSPDVMFVDSACETPVFPYKTRETAAKTIKAALNALTNNISSGYAYTDGAVIRVCKGTHAETDMTLACGVQIVGDTGNPADVVILDNVYYKRAFKIDAAGAVLKDLTISGGGLRIHDYNNAAIGGHVAMSAGTVENCVIRDGRAGHEINSSYSSGRGGNVYMTGGRLVRCQILNGRASETSWLGGYGSSGEGVYASGGVIENCLFSGNGTLNGGLCSGGAILAAGNAAVINCTVVDNKSPANGGGGIYVAGASVRVVNSVFFNNGGDMKSEIGLVNGDCFNCCASSVDNEECATWQVIDESAFRNWSRREEGLKFLVPRTGKPLVGTGTDADGYAAAGGTSSVDLLGKNRQFGKRLDIGCLESQAGGTLIFVR